MATSHAIEYSKTSKSVCKAPSPCFGSPIAQGTIRYGATKRSQLGETVEWRHWGCVTPQILGDIAAAGVNRAVGFDTLSREDQAKIRRALASRRIDPADVPDSAKIPGPAVIDKVAIPAPAPSQKKRKAPQKPVLPPSFTAGTSSSQASRSSKSVSAPVIDISDDEEEIDEPEVIDELYCVLNSQVVGVRYYNGMVGPGEEIRLVRQPHNEHDSNAIQVKNISNVQIGHIPRNVASKLAPLMDRNAVTVEGIMHEGNLTGSHYSLSITLKIYGPTDARHQLEPQLVWATPRQAGFPPPRGASAASHSHVVPGAPAPRTSMPSASQSYSTASSSKRPNGLSAAQAKAQQEAIKKQQESLAKAVELRSMLNNLEKVDDEGRRGSLLDTLCSADDILNLPLHPDPPGTKNGQLTVDLLKHQSQALQWCIEREYPVLPKAEKDKPVQFWQMRLKPNKQPYYYNIATKTPTEQPPTLGRGALCADSMGLGKTLTMLSLIVATQKDIPADFSKSTLIVVPLSVMSNWEKQIDDHCVQGVISSCVYYGSGRGMTAEELRQYDVVITTYQTVTGEFADAEATKGEGPSKKKKKKLSKALFDVPWKRVILDEGHNIRNPRTKMAKAVCGLIAQRRWVLSGTPIINSPRDLGSMLTFLQICRPLDNEDFFKRLLLRPLKDGDPAGAELLRALMSHICIRRTKEMQDSDGNHLVPLPPVEMTVVPVKLSDEARELYDAVEELSQQRFRRMIGPSGVVTSTVTSNVLSMLTRMRQLALHPGLVPADYLQQLRISEEEEEDVDRQPPPIRVTPTDVPRLQGILAQLIEDCEECPICFNVLTDPRITGCAHAFCLSCITEVLTRDAKCPMDRRPLKIDELVEPAPPTELTQAVQRNDTAPATGPLMSGSSAKIDQLIHLLTLTPATEKSLVFSQFTGFLDRIAEALEETGIPYVRFDGQMSAKKRQETLERFSVPLDDSPGALGAEDEASLPSKRARRSSKKVILDDDDFNMDADDDGDFVAIASATDDDFLDDEDDDGPFANKSQKKHKAKKGKGKGKAATQSRASIRAGFDGSSFGGENPKVMLISLKAGALGLNLTVANNVYLMDPWWQEGIESQAIDRCNRIGQKKPVHVYQMIAEDTVEAKVIEIQERKKDLITQAFSGIKRVESQRQKKEARLQDLIELFGVRQQAASQKA